MAIIASRLAGHKTKIIASEHNDYRVGPSSEWTLHRLAMVTSMRVLYPKAHAVVTVSNGVADTVSKMSGIRRDQIEVIYNPIAAPDLRSPAPKGVADEWLNHAAGPRLIAVGSMKEQKGFRYLLKALAAVREHVDAHLLILGEGEQRSELTSIAASLGIANALTMPGYVKNPAPFLAASDVFVLSSLWEGFGNVLVEAMAAGTKVVSTDCPSGPKEILAGTRGRLVPPSDPTALANGILAALEEDQDESTLRRRAADFSVEKAAARYRALMGV